MQEATNQKEMKKLSTVIKKRKEAYKKLCAKIAYEKTVEVLVFPEGKPKSVKRTFSRFDDSFIGEGVPHKCVILKMLIKLGVTEQIQTRLRHTRERDKSETPSQVGFNPKKKMWFGWSHRGYLGFAIGDKFVTAFSEKKNNKVCNTLEDCKKAASIFAESLS